MINTGTLQACSRALLLGTAGCWAQAVAAQDGAVVLPISVAPIWSDERADRIDSKIRNISESRLGCSIQAPAASSELAGCDIGSGATGFRFDLRASEAAISVEAYSIAAQTYAGPFSGDSLLLSPGQRSLSAGTFMMTGVKTSFLDGRLTLTNEFALAESRRSYLEPDLPRREWTGFGTSRLHKVEAVLIDRPKARWSLTAQLHEVSDEFSVGRSMALLPYFSLPGQRVTASTTAKVGGFKLSAAFDRYTTSFGVSASKRATASFDGITFKLSERTTDAEINVGASQSSSRSRSVGAYLELDFATLRQGLLKSFDGLGPALPQSLSVYFRTGTTNNVFDGRMTDYRTNGLDIDATWMSPLGDTTLNFWRDRRVGLGLTDSDRLNTTFMLSHVVRRGGWRFGLDGSLFETTQNGSSDYRDRSIGWGALIGYTAPNGPDFRFQLNRERGSMRMQDDLQQSERTGSYVTASLDLTRYLQKRFERNDLRLTVDYRRRLDSETTELNMFDEQVERYFDRDRRDGFLMTFGMKL